MITLDNNVQFSDDTGSTTATFSFTTGTGDNRLLVVAVPESRTIGINSVTYNGLLLTLGKSTINGATSARVYYMIAPPQGTYDIVVTYSASLTFRSVRASSFFGVEQTSTIGAITEETGASNNKDLSITTTKDNSLVISCLTGGGIHTPTSGQTWMGDSNEAENRVSAWIIIPTSGLYTDSWSSNDTLNREYSYNLIEFKAAPEQIKKGNIFFGFGGGKTPEPVNPTPVPTAYYTADTGSGTTLYDSVGTNDGSITGATWTTGIIGDALSFDGNDYVDTTYILPSTGDFSISMICYNRNNSGVNNVYLSTENVTTGAMNNAFNPNNNPNLAIRNVGAVTSSVTVIDEWCFIVITRSGNDFNFYVNSVLEGTLTSSASMPQVSAYLGIQRNNLAQGYDGIQDEIGFYNNVVLTQEHIDYMWNGGIYRRPNLS